MNFLEHTERLEWLGEVLKEGDRVQVVHSGRVGQLVSRRRPARDGWNVEWDEPMFGVRVSRVATQNLLPMGFCASCFRMRWLARRDTCTQCDREDARVLTLPADPVV